MYTLAQFDGRGIVGHVKNRPGCGDFGLTEARFAAKYSTAGDAAQAVAAITVPECADGSPSDFRPVEFPEPDPPMAYRKGMRVESLYCDDDAMARQTAVVEHAVQTSGGWILWVRDIREAK